MAQTPSGERPAPQAPSADCVALMGRGLRAQVAECLRDVVDGMGQDALAYQGAVSRGEPADRSLAALERALGEHRNTLYCMLSLSRNRPADRTALERGYLEAAGNVVPRLAMDVARALATGHYPHAPEGTQATVAVVSQAMSQGMLTPQDVGQQILGLVNQALDEPTLANALAAQARQRVSDGADSATVRVPRPTA